MKIPSKVVFSITFLLVLILFISSSSAELGKAIKTEKGWNVIYSTDEDYFVWTADKNKQKTEICLLSKTATKISDIENSKNAYINKELRNFQSLNRKQKKASETGLSKDYFGYCRIVDTEKYLKFGEHSTILVYQEESKVSYIIGEDYIEFTLLKNINGDYVIHSSNIFVNYDNETYKFGAIDNSNTGISPYRYSITSTYPIRLEETDVKVYLANELHNINFDDICLKQYSNCTFNQIDAFTINLDFYSDREIDPIINVSQLPSLDTSLISLSQTTFAFAQSFNGNLTLDIYYTNGTAISSGIFVNRSVSSNSRVELAKINDTALAYYFYNDLNQNSYWRMFDNLGNAISPLYLHKQLGEGGGNDRIDISAFYGNGFLWIGLINDNSNRAELDRININNGTFSSYTLDNNVKPESLMQNLIGCGFINSSLIGCSFYDRDDDDATMVLFSTITNSVLTTIDVDNNVGKGQTIGIGSFDRFMTLFYDQSGGDDIQFGIYSGSGSLISLQTLKVNSGNPSLSLATTYSEVYNHTLFIASWYDAVDLSIYNFIINRNGTILGNVTITNPNPTYPLFTTYGQDINNKGFINDTFAIGYTNSSGRTNVITYWINGTIWDGAEIDTFSPQVNLLSPLNNSYFNYSNISFSANFTDDKNLKNATLFILNSTLNIVNTQSILISGTYQSVNLSYNFTQEGNYYWYYQVFDASNKFSTSEMRSVTYDISPPIIEYKPHTEENNSFIYLDEVHVNISVIDISPTNTTIFLYKLINGTYVLSEQFSSTSKSVFAFFDNLVPANYGFNASTCDILGYCSETEFREVLVASLTEGKVEFLIEFSEYPYVEPFELVNISVSIKLSEGYTIANANVTMSIKELNGSLTIFPLYYNYGTQKYENAIIFNQTGNYDFIIYSDLDGSYDLEETGTFRVREAFYVTFEGFIDKTNKSYVNNFAWVTAELSNPADYDKYLEPFFSKIKTSSGFAKPVWYAPYIDGKATLKLWEDEQEYLIRLRDGRILFVGNYAVPQVIDSYGTNMVIGQFELDENQTIKFLVTKKDLKPYFWLINLLLFIGIIFCVLLSLGLFFIIPQYPLLSLVFFFISVFGIVIIRIAIFLYFRT